MRDPGQVFALLEALYGAFDYLANRRGVFKVETIGDSYVAVTGLPEPRKDHAAAMVRFARDCRVKMNDLTRKLEVSLGPDTGDLTMRFGLHSGPVTAGVLRSQNSRFQLFGTSPPLLIVCTTPASHIMILYSPHSILSYLLYCR
jgi:class 3 adenylate cyclase